MISSNALPKMPESCQRKQSNRIMQVQIMIGSNSKTNIFHVKKGRGEFFRLVIFWLVPMWIRLSKLWSSQLWTQFKQLRIEAWIRLPWSAVQLNWIPDMDDVNCRSRCRNISCKSFMVEMMVTKGQKWKRGARKSDYLVVLWKWRSGCFDRSGRCLYHGMPSAHEQLFQHLSKIGNRLS